MGLITKLFGTRSEREIKKIAPLVDKILSMEEEYKARQSPGSNPTPEEG